MMNTCGDFIIPFFSATSRSDDLKDMGQGQKCIHNAPSLSASGEYLYQAWKQSICWRESCAADMISLYHYFFLQNHKRMILNIWGNHILTLT